MRVCQIHEGNAQHYIVRNCSAAKYKTEIATRSIFHREKFTLLTKSPTAKKIFLSNKGSK